jgi:hypothetical protein
VVAGTQRLRAGDRQRLAARARQRDAVLVAFGQSWPGADVEVVAGVRRPEAMRELEEPMARCRPSPVARHLADQPAGPATAQSASLSWP